MIPLPALLALLVALLLPQPMPAQQYGGGAYWRPPIVPLEFKVNHRGEFEVGVVPEMITPLGTFGIGGGVSNAFEDGNTYFVVRDRGGETVYALGTDARINMKTIGQSEIELSMIAPYDNAFLIDVRNVEGSFKIEFVPDTSTKVLAHHKVNMAQSLVLERDGVLRVDALVDMKIPLDDVVAVKLYGARDLGPFGQEVGDFLAVTWRKGDGYPSYACQVEDTESPSFRWFAHCLERMVPDRTVKQYEPYMTKVGSVWISDDGGFLMPVAAGTATFASARDIKSVSRAKSIWGKPIGVKVALRSTPIPAILGPESETDLLMAVLGE